MPGSAETELRRLTKRTMSRRLATTKIRAKQDNSTRFSVERLPGDASEFNSIATLASKAVVKRGGSTFLVCGQR
jgi:hypothetical protein